MTQTRLGILVMAALIGMVIPSINAYHQQTADAMEHCLKKQTETTCNLLVYSR